ncbi:hypothetical protein K2173_007210 [Erythroxylum novogranatense]|uniref:Protein kinase domain-containing protein n=1 Tax=Erythroxylum novogranatense TaxID=1862640 RepID=A0AAV8SYM8_9ROSI|nr:hypothetical protein K2173_007210 [Erythroxylum novogranatense]
MGNAGQLKEFPLELLVEATNNFSEDHETGTGSFGSVYRGVLGDGREVAIKRTEASCSSSYAIGTKRQEDIDSAFVRELESLSRVHHKHLVHLLGFCENSNDRILVFEYMHNGTLHDHLHNLQRSPLMTWPARIKLALDAARGIEYLHENENGVPRNVVDFVVPYIVQDEILRVLDRRVPPPTPFEIEAVVYIGYLAADCVTLEGRDRPPMTEVVNSLERALAACLVDPTSLSRSNTESST